MRAEEGANPDTRSELPIGAAAAPIAKQRDLRFDFFRGLALLQMCSVHLHASRFAEFRLGKISYCTGTEVFVFISGFVCGMAYLRALQRGGFGACQLKATKRCAQLYGAQLAMLALCVGIFAAFAFLLGADGRVFRLQPMLDDPVPAIRRALMLTYTPLYMDILKLYIMLLLPLPLFLLTYRRWPWLAAGASVLLYGVAQVWPLQTALPDYPPGRYWLWNPMGWQLMFFIGVGLGADKIRGIRRFPRGKAWLWMAIAAVIGLLVLRQAVELPWRAVDKLQLAPMRVMSMLIAAYVVASLLPATAKIWRSRVLTPVIRVGHHALPVYFFSVIFDYLGSFVLIATGGGLVLELMLFLGGLAMMMLVAEGLSRRRSRRDRQITPASIATSVEKRAAA